MSNIPARTLDDIAAEINKECVEGYKDVVRRYIRIGELLLEAKSNTKHKQWAMWCEDHLSFGTRQAQKYMRIANGASELLSNANPSSLLEDGASVNKVAGLLAAPTPEPKSTPEPEPQETELLNSGSDNSKEKDVPPVEEPIDVEFEDATTFPPKSVSDEQPMATFFRAHLQQVVEDHGQTVISNYQAAIDASEGKEHKIRSQWMSEGVQWFTKTMEDFLPGDNSDAYLVRKAAKIINLMNNEDQLRKRKLFSPPRSLWDQAVIPGWD